MRWRASPSATFNRALRRHEVFDALRHAVELPTQVGELVLPLEDAFVHPRLELLIGDIARRRPEAIDRPGNVPRQDETEQPGDSEDRQNPPGRAAARTLSVKVR